VRSPRSCCGSCGKNRERALPPDVRAGVAPARRTAARPSSLVGTAMAGASAVACGWLRHDFEAFGLPLVLCLDRATGLGRAHLDGLLGGVHDRLDAKHAARPTPRVPEPLRGGPRVHAPCRRPRRGQRARRAAVFVEGRRRWLRGRLVAGG